MDQLISGFFNQQLEASNFNFLILGLAFAGGVLSSLSPCSLGMLPIVVGYIGGAKEENTKSSKTAIQMLSFLLGLSFVLTILGIIGAVTGKMAGAFSSATLVIVMTSLILLMGLNMLGLVEIPIPTIVKQMPQNKGSNLFVYPFSIGSAFALAATPCSTPILAAILAYTAIKANIMLGAALLFLFALGQGMILVFAGIFTSFFKKALAFRSASGHLLKVSGGLLVVTAVFAYLKIFGVV